MAKRTPGKSGWQKQLHLVLALVLAAACGSAGAADWRMVIASVDVVVIVDAATFVRDGQQLAFRSAVYPPLPDADGAIGSVGDITFDCAGNRMKSEQMQDIRPDGSTSRATGDKPGFTAVEPRSVAELFLDRMCRIKPEGNKINGVGLSVPPAVAAKAVFGLLKLGLDSKQASELATLKYWDETTLLEWLDGLEVPKDKRSAVRKVLASQTVQRSPPPAPIVPLASAVATGKVGKYTYSAPEIGASLWLRADGTFRYGLTVGSLDETAAGRWTATGNRVQLVNEPRPKAPTVTAGPGRLEPGTPLSLSLRTPAGGGVPGVDLVVEFDAGAPLEIYTQGAIWTLPEAEKRQPRFVTFAWPSYGLGPARFAVDTRVANTLAFVFNPNDFGVVDLTGLAVDADQNGLVLHRGDATMRFRKASQ